jgi:hypothetical protein
VDAQETVTSKRILTRVIAAALLINGGLLGPAVPAFAQAASSCGVSNQGGATRLQALKATLKEMSTNDPAVIDKNLKQYTKIVAHWRLITPGEENAATRMYGDALDFWREKKAHEETGGMVDVQSGKRWASYLQGLIDQIAKCERERNGQSSETNARPLNLSGSYTCEGPPCSEGTDTVSQSGEQLTFKNEKGKTSSGHFLSKFSVIADDWEGGLRGEVSSDGKTITWANGSKWTRK